MVLTRRGTCLAGVISQGILSRLASGGTGKNDLYCLVLGYGILIGQEWAQMELLAKPPMVSASTTLYSTPFVTLNPYVCCTELHRVRDGPIVL